MPGAAQGFVDHRRRVIALSAALAPNGQVAVLVHELAHVHGARYAAFGRAGAEVWPKRPLSAARLDTGRLSVPYVSGWADARAGDLWLRRHCPASPSPAEPNGRAGSMRPSEVAAPTG